MKENKPISIHHLIVKKLLIFIAIFFVGIWGFNTIAYDLLDRYWEVNFPVALPYQEYLTLPENELLDRQMQILVLDDTLKVINNAGMEILESSSFSAIEISEYISGSNPEQLFYVSLYPASLVNSLTTSISTIPSNNIEYSVPIILDNTAPTQVLPTNAEYILLVEEAGISSGFSYDTISLLISAIMIANILLGIAILILFVRSIYKPLNLNFKIIEDKIGQIPSNNSHVDITLTSLKEGQNVLCAYNRMVDSINSETTKREQAVELNRQLISNLTHDLKSPITILKGYCEVLSSEELDSPSQKEYISYIEKSSSDLDKLVSLLFEQVRYQNGEHFSPERADINAILRDICANYYMIFDKEGFEFISNISEDSYYSNIDCVNIKRVFSNLLQNILNHNPQPTQVMVESIIYNNSIVIKIKDNGAGILSKDKPKIFDAFFQGDISRSSSNSGIGLYIVKEIIQKHGGTIALIDEPDYKTVFIIQLR